MTIDDVERQIECDLTKNPRREETKTPIAAEQCRRNSMKAIGEIEV